MRGWSLESSAFHGSLASLCVPSLLLLPLRRPDSAGLLFSIFFFFYKCFVLPTSNGAPGGRGSASFTGNPGNSDPGSGGGLGGGPVWWLGSGMTQAGPGTSPRGGACLRSLSGSPLVASGASNLCNNKQS